MRELARRMGVAVAIFPVVYLFWALVFKALCGYDVLPLP